ncbi:hypothetical protein PQO03_08815 [Lentisphaera profundi]|uniref:DUF304 domain-containing protein n=1 Tax=Lentisphaera profundi TaxID=1658616 RepID=A0ABY7VRF9_9BACT|nr:hypothetical protein [Lentisphaera profundi]WDE95815.1 hypothetical protein PQO03_08815 [Lentisphaera profundi]
MNQYIINPKEYKKDKVYLGCMVIFWLIWAPATMIVCYLAISKKELFFFLWLIFGFIGFFGIPYAIYSRNRIQKIIIESEKIHFHGTGVLPNSKISINHQSIRMLTLEHYDDESVFSLNVQSNKSPKRIMLASMVHPDHKAKIYNELKSFFSSHGIECEYINHKT